LRIEIIYIELMQPPTPRTPTMNHRAIPFLARIAQGQTDDVVPILRNEYGQNPTAIAELCADRVALMEFWMTAEGVRINDQDSLGETVLQHAVHQGYAEAIPVLIQQGARADQALIKQAAAQGQTASLGALLDAGIPIQTIGRSSALGVAAIYGHTDTVRDLLARGADLEARNGSWQTPLYMAASRGHTDTMQVLLDAGAWVNPPKIGRTPSPTPLQGASEFGVQSEAAQLLLDRGAKIDAQNESGHTALMLAARSGNLEVVGLLLERGADTSLVSRRGESAEEMARSETKPIFTAHRERQMLRQVSGVDENIQDQQPTRSRRM
jgi:ankyrin repeat protein